MMEEASPKRPRLHLLKVLAVTCAMSFFPAASCVKAAQAAVQHGTFIAELSHAPYPYGGKYDDTCIDFFDYRDPATGERFHTTRNGDRFSRKAHYSDSSTLFHIPAKFNPKKPFEYVVFFHGHGASVRKFLADYALDEQIEDSGRNVILVLPQLAVDAVDSSPGKFFRKKAFRAFMREAAEVLAPKVGKKYRQKLKDAPIILAAFSGGYKSAAFVLDRGGVASRLKGVLLLDALYDDLDKFESWIRKNARRSFFLNIFTEGSCQENSLVLAQSLMKHRIQPSDGLPKKMSGKGVYFVQSRNEHMSIPLEGPPPRPLTWLLKTLRP